MTNPYAHDPNCAFWFDHYDFECTCGASASRPGMKLANADMAQEMRAIRAKIAELRKRIEQLEAWVASLSG